MSKQEQALERIYTVPLTKAWITARHKRTKRAVRVLREFAERHMKSSEVKIDTELNEKLWNDGITKPPRKIVVRMEKDDDGVVTISLPKVEKREETSAETISSESPDQLEDAPASDQAKAGTQEKRSVGKRPSKKRSK